jgi:transcriptional regulator with XRE-family HTH domain
MLGDKMKAVLKAAKENQYTACEKLGISQGCLNLWLNNKRNPNPAEIKKFCETFNVTPNFLFGFEDISESDLQLLKAIKNVAANTQNASKTQNTPQQTPAPEKER